MAHNSDQLIRVLSDLYDPDELVDLLGINQAELLEAFLDRAYELAHKEGITVPEYFDNDDDATVEFQDEDELPDGFHVIDNLEEWCNNGDETEE